MKQRTRCYFTPSEMAGVWDRWEKGESLNAIARDLDRSHSTVQGALARTGGIRRKRVKTKGRLFFIDFAAEIPLIA